MDMRQIEVIAPRGIWTEIDETLEAHSIEEVREDKIENGLKSIRFFSDSVGAKELLAIFEKRFKKKDGFRIILSPVEAILPRVEEEELPDEIEREEEKKGPKEKLLDRSNLLRIHPEELYQQLLSDSKLDLNKILLYILSAIVATIGLAYDNIPIIIGSMVLAPFLGPNVGLALGTTLGDKTLIKKGIANLLVGTLLVATIASAIGFFYTNPDPLASQVYLSYYMIILSFISGVAAILYILQKNNSGLVGVMVAVSLLPPLTLAGLLFGAGMLFPAFKALMLFLVNIVCLNLAGIVTFILAGVRPNNRREVKKAREQTKKAVIIRSILLVLLIAFIYFFTK